MRSPKHIVITVIGSLGDLHPMMALALGLQARGHQVTIAASNLYQDKIEREGIGFSRFGPEIDEFDQRTFDELFDRRRGPEILIKKYLLPHVRDNFNELRPLLEKADFLVNAPTAYAGPLVAEHLKMPWASVALQPFFYISAYDPPVLAQLPITEHWRGLGPGFWRMFMRLLVNSSNGWPKTVYQLRDELGLPDRGNPIFDGQFSPYLNLGMFSSLIAQPQPDWPPNTEITGFVFYDRMKPDEQALPDEIRRFLDAGEPPVVFTLGSSVVRTSTSFYETSVKAAQTLGCRAIFVAGEHRPPLALNERMLWWDAVAYSALFPHAAAVVHQGGIGTTAQALRAGKPTLIVPHGFDQPDNAARIKRLGTSRTIHPEHYTVKRVVSELENLLGQTDYTLQANRVGQNIQQEDGLETACNCIESLL